MKDILEGRGSFFKERENGFYVEGEGRAGIRMERRDLKLR
jgi:hypothetical protein